MSDAGKRARLIVLEGAEPSFELGVVAALLGSEALEGAVVVAALRGGAAALGRYQRVGRTGYALICIPRIGRRDRQTAEAQ